MQTIAILLAISFTVLTVVHIYWALGGRRGTQITIPAINGRPLFSPGCITTLVVALILAGFAVIAIYLGFYGTGPDRFIPHMRYAGYAIGVLLIVRAIGEFNYVGFFKRKHNCEFAVYDSLIYSPFCLLSGCAYLFLAMSRA